MGKAGKGKAGCGCLIFALVACMVLAGALVHPFSLRIMAGRFRHEDKVVPCDAIFVPRIPEDKNGEVYTEAFREYWAGDGKAIWVEDDRLFGLGMKDIVGRMARERGIKEDAVHALSVEGDDAAKARAVRAALQEAGDQKGRPGRARLCVEEIPTALQPGGRGRFDARPGEAGERLVF